MTKPKKKKSEKTESLRVLDKAYEIRSTVENMLLKDFGYDEDKAIRKVQYLAKINHISEDKVEEWIENRVDRDVAYHHWYIKQERSFVLQLARDITTNLVAANSIYPTRMSEYDERRVRMDRSIEACRELEKELQHISAELPVDHNRYTKIGVDLDDLITKIKNLRKSDNRFLKHIPNESMQDFFVWLVHLVEENGGKSVT